MQQISKPIKLEELFSVIANVVPNIHRRSQRSRSALTHNRQLGRRERPQGGLSSFFNVALAFKLASSISHWSYFYPPAPATKTPLLQRSGPGRKPAILRVVVIGKRAKIARSNNPVSARTRSVIFRPSAVPERLRSPSPHSHYFNPRSRNKSRRHEVLDCCKGFFLYPGKVARGVSSILCGRWCGL